jgi:hypothetical protein
VSVLVELEELRERVAAAKVRVGELDRARKDGGRRVQRARARLTGFLQERERRRGQATDVDPNGDPLQEPTEPTEEELVEELRQAEGGVTVRASLKPYGGGMSAVELEPVDERADALWEGAKVALTEREAELRTFVRENLPGIAAARAPAARAVQGRATAVLEAARRGAGEWERERTFWAQTLVAGGLEPQLQTLPDNPFRWAMDAPREGGLPMPESFT